MQKKLKIGIITFHNVYNYGAILQTYALCAALKEYDVKIVNYEPLILHEKKSHNLYSRKKSIFSNLKHFLNFYILRRGITKEKKFNHFLNFTIPLTYPKISSLAQLEDKFDLIIVGSDQVWNPTFTGNRLDENYFLHNIKYTCKKISYASSAGSYKFNDSEITQLKKYLDSFDSISVREKSLAIQLKNIINKKVDVTLDPTLLLSKKQWAALASNSKIISSNYLLVYTFDNDSLCFNLAKEIANDLNLIVVAINSKYIKPRNVDIIKRECGPLEFIDLFLHADFIITNSFHGTSFSINFEKNFFTIKKKNNPDRVQNLLSIFDLEDRLISNISEFDKDKLNINYSKINNKILKERSLSEMNLYTSIENLFTKQA